MVTRDVFQVLKLHSPAARAILRTFKTSLVPIYHVMHSRSYDFLYIVCVTIDCSGVTRRCYDNFNQSLSVVVT